MSASKISARSLVPVVVGGAPLCALGPLVGMLITGPLALTEQNWRSVVGLRLLWQLGFTTLVAFGCANLWLDAARTPRWLRIAVVMAMGTLMSAQPLRDFIAGPRRMSGTITDFEYLPGASGTRYSGTSRFAEVHLTVGDTELGTIGFAADRWNDRWSEQGCRETNHLDAKYLAHLGFPLRVECTGKTTFVLAREQQEKIERSMKPRAFDPQQSAEVAGEARMLQSLRRYDEAIVQANVAIAMNDANPLAWYVRGICELKEGAHEAGCASLLRARNLGSKELTRWPDLVNYGCLQK